MKYQAVKLDDGSFGCYNTIDKTLCDFFIDPIHPEGAKVNSTRNEHQARQCAAYYDDAEVRRNMEQDLTEERTAVFGLSADKEPASDAPVPTVTEVDDLMAEVEDESTPLPEEGSPELANTPEDDIDDGFKDEGETTPPVKKTPKKSKKK